MEIIGILVMYCIMLICFGLAEFNFIKSQKKENFLTGFISELILLFTFVLSLSVFSDSYRISSFLSALTVLFIANFSELKRYILRKQK